MQASGDGDPITIKQVAEVFKSVDSTIRRYKKDGIIKKHSKFRVNSVMADRYFSNVIAVQAQLKHEMSLYSRPNNQVISNKKMGEWMRQLCGTKDELVRAMLKENDVKGTIQALLSELHRTASQNGYTQT